MLAETGLEGCPEGRRSPTIPRGERSFEDCANTTPSSASRGLADEKDESPEASAELVETVSEGVRSTSSTLVSSALSRW